MSTFIDNIFDKIGNVILPKTVTKAVWGQTSGNRLDQELDGIEAALAQPNTGTSADRAYSAGKYIYHVKNKELYKAKSNIASGAAFNKASGGNVDVVNIGDQLQTISSDLTSLITETFTCTSGTPSLLGISNNKATLRRYGKIGIVEIEAWSLAEIAAGTTINITITGLKIAAGANGCSYSRYCIIGYGVSPTNNGNDVLITARYLASNIPASSYQEMFRFPVLLA